MSCYDVITFDDKVEQLRRDVLPKAPPAIEQYFKDYLGVPSLTVA